ncbi:MAG: DNA polymerase III subunit epsilon [Alphaproteobacteria bacterium]|nr:DNA polymerase III subunit epsilon [Alphaproteobacteria bacterium]
MREIALDTETTGLDPMSGHRIIEIGAVEMMDKIRTGRSFQCYLNPEREVPEEAFRVHGISTAFLLDKPLFAQTVDGFLDFIGEAPLVIHNAAFDLKFINHELDRVGFPGFTSKRAIDTVELSRKKFPGAPANLDALCRRFNIDLGARVKHGALLDAELLADVYLELCGGRQAIIHFFDTGSPGQVLAAKRPLSIPPRVFAPSPEEVEAHGRFISTIKNAMWQTFSFNAAEAA